MAVETKAQLAVLGTLLGSQRLHNRAHEGELLGDGLAIPHKLLGCEVDGGTVVRRLTRIVLDVLGYLQVKILLRALLEGLD